MTASTDSAELAGLLQKTPLTRRAILVSTLSVGFAAAVEPVTAQTLTTDTTGLDAGEVKIPTADGEIPAYRAMPTAKGPHAVVLVVQEIFGVHEHIKTSAVASRSRATARSRLSSTHGRATCRSTRTTATSCRTWFRRCRMRR